MSQVAQDQSIQLPGQLLGDSVLPATTMKTGPAEPDSLRPSSMKSVSVSTNNPAPGNVEMGGPSTELRDIEPTAQVDLDPPMIAAQIDGKEEQGHDDRATSERLDSQVLEVATDAEVEVRSEEQDQMERRNLLATLYCRKNGYTHTSLLNFGIYRCTACNQDLSKPGTREVEREHVEDEDEEDDKSKNDHDDNDESSEPVPAHLNIIHSVEYRDIGNFHIDTQDWGRPFNLEKERYRAFRKNMIESKEPILKVITVLRTTVPADPARMSYESQNIMAKGIMGNPGISVTPQSIKLIILSRLFIDALKAVLSYDTDDLLEGGKLELCEPYVLIGHHFEELQTYMRQIEAKCSTNPTANAAENDDAVDAAAADISQSLEQETLTHMRLVLNFVSSTIQDPITKELALYQQDPPVCTYRMLWLLFRPGSAVYVQYDDVADTCMVEMVDMGELSFSCPHEDLKACQISLWYLDFNGQYITRAREKATIQPFNGERPITSLNVVPCEFWDQKDNKELRIQLKERGKKWIDHLAGKQVEYEGEEARPGNKTKSEGRAYVDCSAYYDLDGVGPDFEQVTPLNEGNRNVEHMDCPCSRCRAKARELAAKASGGRRSTRWAHFDRINTKEIHDLVDPSLPPDLKYMLCSRQLKGFMFNTRTWQTVDVRFCQPSKPDQNPFGKLVMPEHRKVMIKALVYKYTDPRYAGGNPQQVWGADFIKNKGEGQVFLLHGGPGVGKTFTAECIAEFTGRPLLALTCGDIGTDEVQMERKLRDWLRLAHRWGAVMLIDEADVYLEKRLDADLKRNSLVSVFLREIEYYQGILFLTTNRVGRFDDAFISRIHVVIHYQDLDDEYRRKIWNQFFDKLQKERGSTMEIDDSARHYVLENPRILQVKWNGREIRNAFQTAVALAEYRFLTKPELEKGEGEIAVLEERDFEQICDMTMRFKEYMTAMNDGQDEQGRAWGDGVRLAMENA